jgi:hypothetical protein
MKDACREAFEAWCKRTFEPFPEEYFDYTYLRSSYAGAFQAGWNNAMAHAVDLCKRRMMRECKSEFDTAQTMEACAIAALLEGADEGAK